MVPAMENGTPRLFFPEIRQFRPIEVTGFPTTSDQTPGVKLR